MIRTTHSATLPYPPAEVFRAVTDFRTYPAWQEDVVESRLEGDEPALGATVRQTRRFMNMRTDAVMTIAEFEPDRLLSLRTRPDSRLRVDQSFRIEATPDGTYMSIAIELDGLSRLAEHAVGKSLEAYVQRQLDRLDHLLADRGRPA